MSADLREQLQRTLTGSYTLERELGGGGMSRVFLAEETRLGRKVVVKVLSLELAASLSAERFEREIRVAASLQPANIWKNADPELQLKVVEVRQRIARLKDVEGR